MENSVIERIKRVIEYKNKSPRAFAIEIGFNYATLNNYLTGRRSAINNDLLSKIASSYDDISLNWLLTGEGEMLAISKDRAFNTEAERFKMVRQSLELTIPETAKILEVATSVIEGIEKNSIPVNNIIKQKMKAIFNVDPLYIDGNAEKVYLSSGGFMQARKIAKEQKVDNSNITTLISETRPRIPYTAAAGSLTSAVEGVTAEQCEQIPRITAFPNYDFTIIIKGNSMEPKYEGGDEVACKRIDNTSFIQWGKVHVMDTAQGIIIKRIYEDDNKVRCVSYNPEYPDFSISKEEIYSMSLIVGLLRM